MSASEVAIACVAGIQDEDLRTRVHSELETLESNNVEYRRVGASGGLWSVLPEDFPVGAVSDDEFLWLYENKLVGSSSKARGFYDELLASAILDRCPYCNVNRPRTLDHFLPKRPYCTLAIDPWNLVPSCKDCNHGLGAIVASHEADALFHPYFEAVEGDWLAAEVQDDGGEPTALFFIAPPIEWDERTEARTRFVWDHLRLNDLYGSAAGAALAEAAHQAALIADAGGADAVRAHFEDAANSVLAASPNNWRGALYRAMAASDWYCSEGFAL